MSTTTHLPRPRTSAALTKAEANAFNHLSRNAESCVRKNIRVHVENINVGQTAAMCSAEQRAFGLFKRELHPSDLVQEAERALAPLRGVGITPLIVVRHTLLHNSTANMDDVMTQPAPGFWGRMGQRFRAFMYLARVPRTQTMDPFGWRRAMTVSNLTS